MKKQLFLIIGAPGSGKTTDAQLIAQNNQELIAHYSTGDLLRAEVASGSQRGKMIEGFTSKGNLVPLDIVVGAIIQAIKQESKNTVILDGYPRSVEQMEALDEILKEEEGIQLVSVIEVVVSEEVAKDRVLGRARGKDDNVEVFKNRMKVYNEPLREIEEFYTGQQLLHKVNGERTIEEIVADIDAYIKSKLN